MYDCNKDVRAFHDVEVTLPVSERHNMQVCLDHIRERLKRNLEKNDDPLPYEHVSQGSYQMKTMVRDPKNEYGIEDGAYFKKNALIGKRGACMTAIEARQMVFTAMKEGTFKIPPEVRNNCVRVYYSAGYHIDILVYRRVKDDGEGQFELAAGSSWKRSDARYESDWYESECSNSNDSIQFRRVNRYLTKQANSRKSWKSQNLSGFGISVLVAEKFKADSNRDDRALYNTMFAIRERLNNNTVIDHPVTSHDTITSNDPDSAAIFFRDRLSEVIANLAPLFDEECDREAALMCWDTVFYTTFFTKRENFNYISFNNWKPDKGTVDDVSMHRGRMFEYTPSDIEKRLDNLDATATRFLTSLPTFVCSEVSWVNGMASMIIKFGRIETIRIEPKEVIATFKTLLDFGELEFDNLAEARTVFEADKLQLYRTHWAVRSGSAREVLERLAELKPEFLVRISEFLDSEGEEEKVSLPRRVKNIIGKADSVEAFLKLLYDSSSKSATETFFRGHSNFEYELTPSLLRKQKNGNCEYFPKEHRLCKELLIAHYDEFQGDAYCFDRLVRMQHYGLPTRLLDISGNPLVALFFACAVPEDKELEGEVIIFDVDPDRIKYYDSDTVSCLSNLSNLTYAQKDTINLFLDQVEFNKTPVVSQLLHYIKSEKGFFESRIVPADLGSIVCVKAKQTNNRIKSQSGASLLFGHEAKLPDNGQDGIEIRRITITKKKNILSELDRININATSVYPSIDQTAKHLKLQCGHRDLPLAK